MCFPAKRPDRDEYINVDTSRAPYTTAKKYIPFSSHFWLNTNHPYEIKSVMHYDAYSSGPVKMTLKDGRSFSKGRLMTTTDSLQVDEMYCKNFPQYKSKARIQIICSLICTFATT